MELLIVWEKTIVFVSWCWPPVTLVQTCHFAAYRVRTMCSKLTWMILIFGRRRQACIGYCERDQKSKLTLGHSSSFTIPLHYLPAAMSIGRKTGQGCSIASSHKFLATLMLSFVCSDSNQISKNQLFSFKLVSIFLFFASCRDFLNFLLTTLRNVP